MGQTGSAQREPSMEEILASIRRIIQDSDTTEPSIHDHTAPGVVDAALDAPAEEAVSGEIEAFRAGLDEPVPAPRSMAEIQADVVRTAQNSSAPAAEVIPPYALAEPALDEPAPAELPPAGDDGAPEQSAVFAPTTSDPVVSEARPAIISDHAGRQVAAAFGELSEAFAASRRRSIDDMTQEMLRPMLQDWLDNNLPTLVERLVREEIERVARGDG